MRVADRYTGCLINNFHTQELLGSHIYVQMDGKKAFSPPKEPLMLSGQVTLVPTFSENPEMSPKRVKKVPFPPLCSSVQTLPGVQTPMGLSVDGKRLERNVSQTFPPHIVRSGVINAAQQPHFAQFLLFSSDFLWVQRAVRRTKGAKWFH